MTDVPNGPPPVEPMSDVAWARVERGLMTRLDSDIATTAPATTRRRWMWVAGPALAAAAIVVVVLALRPGGEPATGRSDQLTDVEPSRVVTGDAPSSVSFGDAHLALEARSAIVMTHESGSPSVLLERGAAAFTVAPRSGRPPFVVRAGDTIVRVVGTQFRVARADERVAVAVEHGIVDVLFRGSTVRVGAGQSWHSEMPEVVTTIAMGPSVPPPSEPPAPSATPMPPTTPEAPPVVRDPAPHPVKPETAPAPKTTMVAPAPKTPAVVPAPTPPTAAEETERAKYDRLSRLEARDPAAALAGYLQLSSGNSPWAAVGLYAAARLAADRHDPRAATFLNIYLRRFPAGANASDARTLLQRLEGEH